METHHLKRYVGEDNLLKIELPVGLQNTDVEIVIVVQSVAEQSSKIEKAKQQYARAYQPWTPEEEQKMMRMYRTGRKIKMIAQELERQPGAIHSRIEKIEGRNSRK